MIITSIICVFLAIYIGVSIYEAKHAITVDPREQFLHDDFQ